MKPVDKDYRIYAERIYLRPITEDDTDMVLEWRNSKAVVENFIYREPISRDEHLNWLKNKVDKGLVHQFIVCDNVENTPYGCVYLQNFEEKNNKAESGVFLGGLERHSKGIGTEALLLLFKYGFDELDLHKIVGRVLACNKASLRMCEKAGYKQEAYFRDELYLDGKYEDLVMFGMINPKHIK